MRILLFDADGVVIDPPHQFMFYLKHQLQVPSSSASEFFEGAFRECLIGRADIREVIVPFLATWGWKGTVDELLQSWFEMERNINDQLVEVIQKLRQKGFYCGIATNQERCRLNYMTREMGFSNLFDGIFGSADVGAVKPANEFFERITRYLAVEPRNISFWDDSVNNVIGARAYGWQAEHFSSMDGFFATLEQHTLA